MSDKPQTTFCERNMKVSIVLPVHDGERYLRQAVDSILAQTFGDIELIAVNDFSSDGTADILADYASHDKRVRIVTNAINEKLPQSLNNGFRVACGDYLSWTSDDNILKPDCIERLFAGIRVTGADIVYADAEEIDAEGHFTELRQRDHPIENLCFENTIGACFLYRKEVHEKNKGFRTNLFLLEDYDFWVRAWLNGFRYAYLAEVLYEYRRHGNSLSNSFVQRVSYLKLGYIIRMLPAYQKDRHLVRLAEREIGELRRNFYYSERVAYDPQDGIQSEPFNLHNHQNLAEHLLKEGKSNAAGKVVGEALVVFPDWVVGYALKSFCHEMKGELDMAIAFQAEAAWRSQDPSAIERLARLKDKRAIRK